MHRLNKLILAAAFVMVLTPVAFAQERVSYLEYRFDDLDEPTRALLSKFNGQLGRFSEGCSVEQTDATMSFLDKMATDASCGVALRSAWQTKSKATIVGAVITCGWQIPKTLRERAKHKENLKTCQQLEEVVATYKTYCEDRTRWIFAFEDALYCYSPVEEMSLVVFDFKDRKILIKK
jgi:hypothetical protein